MKRRDFTYEGRRLMPPPHITDRLDLTEVDRRKLRNWLKRRRKADRA